MMATSQVSDPKIDVLSEPASFYAYRDGKLMTPLDPEAKPEPVAEFVHDSFRALVLNPRFSCVAAKSAFNKDNYRFSTYHNTLASPEATLQLARDLYLFVNEQKRLQDDGFYTFVATFTEPSGLSEEAFEKLLWAQLQALHDADADVSAWDATVSPDPKSPHFEWSFGGTAFFVVGLHPASSRFTRRFAFPTLVFNAHVQFENLREAGKYGRMQDVIRSRDTNLQGNINPNLADFGASSDARQYSGRKVEGDWACPFHAHHASKAAEK
ncbi:MAG: YqcI/YcgG family protein [Armatimonadetes bacterium]|nr:YqcI/YcgG family protein [Armatimonadota bacterium]